MFRLQQQFLTKSCLSLDYKDRNTNQRVTVLVRQSTVVGPFLSKLFSWPNHPLKFVSLSLSKFSCTTIALTL
jgi:hypothetical protein